MRRPGGVTNMNTYLIVIGKTATGYSAHCPDVSGCASVGKTIEEFTANMKKKLAFHFEGLAEDGLPIPKAGGVHAYPKVMKDLDVDHYFLAHVEIARRRRTAPLRQS